MLSHRELKEIREAREFADHEFRRVKEEKLKSERAKKPSSATPAQTESDKKKEREAANRASAAASRAKIVCYSTELEKRTNRLELERNTEAERADRAIRKAEGMRREMRILKKVLRELWEMKENRTCSHLLDSNVLFLLGSGMEDNEDAQTDGEGDVDIPSPEMAPVHAVPPHKLSPQILPEQPLGAIPPCRTMLPVPTAHTHLPLPVRKVIGKPRVRSNVTEVRHLIHPSSAPGPADSQGFGSMGPN
eukprot:GFKZ01010876.1.p1 GENE.GFKZ01010876.1~~GFKZ01010876.1.p1  ORF type:complete len:248 (+),score=32.67 GFKZ01010876.1:567-1310(+)